MGRITGTQQDTGAERLQTFLHEFDTVGLEGIGDEKLMEALPLLRQELVRLLDPKSEGKFRRILSVLSEVRSRLQASE